MAITVSTTHGPVETADVDLLAVPVFADRELGPGAEAVDAALGGGLGAFMETAGFSGRPDESLVVPLAGGVRARAALLVGLGPRAEVTTDRLRRAGATIARRSTKVASAATTLVAVAPDAVAPDEAAQAVTEGVLLGAYEFLEYKSKAEPSKLRRVLLVGEGPATSSGVTRGNAIAHAVIWARDIVNEPSVSKPPAAFAASARRLLARKSVAVTVWSGPQLTEERLGGVVGVGQGSSRPPRFVRISYRPPGATGHVALVGKGVVFDTGGISLKPADGMEAMKTDMSGAAAVIATMSVLADLGVRTRVTAYAPLVENMPSGTAIRPGDVLKIRNGKTVEVLNTDAEGRLILADALSLAVEDKVDAIVDLATLTGACLVALGDKVAGVLGNHDGWITQVRAAADRAGEPMWQLPLWGDYRKGLDSEVADLRNVSDGRYGGTITAALFLQEFVGDVPWVHLDIAGPARAGATDGYVPKGGTGFGVRTLIELVERYEPPAPVTNGKGAVSSRSSRRAAGSGAGGRARRTPR